MSPDVDDAGLDRLDPIDRIGDPERDVELHLAAEQELELATGALDLADALELLRDRQQRDDRAAQAA